MYRTLRFLIISLVLLNSCHSKDDNNYFFEIDQKFSDANSDHQKIYALYRIELEKYKETKDVKYLVSSKYGELFLYPNDRSKKQIALIYELLKINDDKYDYINIACNFNLAYQFEYTSPKLSLQFLDEAIKIDENYKEKNLFLPHLYHAKGKWYYNQKKYSFAMFYFNKALRNFKKEDKLHVSSMYNNLGMCYEKMGNFHNAMMKVQQGIKILESKPHLTKEETVFLYSMKLNLGIYHYRKKDYKRLESFAFQGFEFYRNQKEYYPKVVNYIDILLEIYQITHQVDKEEKIINVLVNIFPQLKNINDKIDACRILQNYYSKINDINKLKIYSGKLLELNKDYQDQINKELYYTSDILNGYILKNINQEYDYKIAGQRRKNVILILLILLLIIVFGRILKNIRKRNRKEKKIFEDNRNNLEEDIQIHKGKIKNLHLNLNLKIETEKAFLESLKKIKKKKNIDAEQTVKDLYFQTNNLLEIDKKNNELVNESSIENKTFMEKLSTQCSILSDQELRLCVYFRMNLSSKEISLLVNITPGSVRVYKTKIKSKMGLRREEDLTVFLNTIK